MSAGDGIRAKGRAGRVNAEKAYFLRFFDLKNDPGKGAVQIEITPALRGM